MASVGFTGSRAGETADYFFAAALATGLASAFAAGLSLVAVLAGLAESESFFAACL